MKKIVVFAVLLSGIQSAYALDKVKACKKSKDCSSMTEAVLYEARGESLKGQYAVANVIKNRSKHNSFPNSIKKVVNEKSQFSYRNKRKKAKITKEEVEQASKVSYDVIHKKVGDNTKGATFYHSTKVKPKWARSSDMKRTIKIDKHVFYKLKEKK